MHRAVFLDRDGVLNRAVVQDGLPYPPRGLEEVEILPGVPQALAALKAAGFKLLVVTNQPDVARGSTTIQFVEEVNRHLAQSLDIDAFYVCYHDDEDNCACRKPKPGLLQMGAEAWGIDLRSSFMVGDRWRDIEAGAAAGCTTVLVGSIAYRERAADADIRVESLLEAATIITARKQA